MSLLHFFQHKRIVRIGGRTWHFFRWFWHFGGHDYLIEPMSVKRWVVFFPILQKLIDEKKDDIEKAIFRMIDVLPKEIMRPFISLIVSEPLTDKDFKHINKNQMKAVWKCFCEVNDVEYILKWFNVKANENELEISYEDYALFLSEKLKGARLPHEFLDLPVQYFLAIMEGFKRLDNIKDGIPASAERLQEKEKKALQMYYQGLGIMVN